MKRYEKDRKFPIFFIILFINLQTFSLKRIPPAEIYFFSNFFPFSAGKCILFRKEKVCEPSSWKEYENDAQASIVFILFFPMGAWFRYFIII